MRRILVATLTALTVVIGFSAVLTGTASAATSNISVGGVTVNVCNFTSVSAIVTHVRANNPTNEPDEEITDSDVSTALGGISLSDYRLANCGGNNPPSAGNCPRGERWDPRDNRCERDLPRYNDCGEYNRNGIYDIRRGDARYLDTWDRNRNGIACDRDDVIVSNDGRCVTFAEENRTFGTRYNDRVRDLYNEARRSSSPGGTSVTNDERDRILRASDVVDYRNRWTSSRDQLRTICKDDTPEVIIVDNPPVVTTVTQAPPPPPAVSAPSGGSGIPSGDYDGGGFDAAHAVK